MFEDWSLKKRRAPRETASSSHNNGAAAESAVRPLQLAIGGPLDQLGQQSENVRDRVNHMVERLHDLRSLSSEFDLIVGPLNEFVDQHAASRTRLMEVEALLARERDLSASARAELGTLQVSTTKISGDLQDALAALSEREETVRCQAVQVAELRIKAADLKTLADNLDTRLFAESDRAAVLAEDNAALRSEVTASEEARAVSERDLSEARETLGLTQAEASRLQLLTESLSSRIASFNRIVADLEPQLHAARNAAVLAESKYAVEHLARQKSEAARDADRVAHEVEASSQSLKIDGLNSHVANTDKLVAHLRDQLRDQSEAHRAIEKGLRDAIAEKLVLERRLESALEASARTGNQLGEAQRSSTEFANRVDMLTKALAAKDGALDAANRKTASLLERIEGLNNRFAQERSEFESTHRRTIEELQNERAERSLAHGALDIARRSRASLLAQYTELRRRTGNFDPRASDDGTNSEAVRNADSNVMTFAPPEAGT